MGRKLTIGLLGGGQLGRMLCEAAGPLGIEIVVLDQASCPAAQVNPNPKNVVGSFKDPEKIRELARRCDVLTVETEHVDVDVLEEIATRGVPRRVPVHPSWKTLRLIQNKFEQKEHFWTHQIPVAHQMALGVGDAALEESLRLAAERFGFPFMVKAMKDSYDGRGNVKVSGQDDFASLASALGRNRGLYAEKWMPFRTELSVVVIRTEDGDGVLRGLYVYDAVETVHEDSICSLVYMPPRRVPAEACKQAQDLARRTVASLWGRGVFAVEMFLLEDGSLAVNEVAPRPHNSGHLSIEAVPYMSQFKAQLYSILDLPVYTPPFLGAALSLEPRVSQALMINILGGAEPDSHQRLVEVAESGPPIDVDVYLHLYGKDSRPNRKIGHVTLTTSLKARDSPLEEMASEFITAARVVRQDRLQAATPTAPLVDIALSAIDHDAPAAARTSSRNKEAPLVVVTMGSDSDLPVLRAGLDVLEEFGVPYDCTITSAHRTPKRMAELASSAAARGVKVLIAAAGGAAHLPGMLASETTVPVIGVPVKATHLDGLDSLLSIVQMPRGIPTATVGINNSTNAALLAIRILGSFCPEYREKMAEYMRKMELEVVAKAGELGHVGYAAYLQKK